MKGIREQTFWLCAPSALYYLHGRDRCYRRSAFQRRNLSWPRDPENPHGTSQPDGRIWRLGKSQNDHGNQQVLLREIGRNSNNKRKLKLGRWTAVVLQTFVPCFYSFLIRCLVVIHLNVFRPDTLDPALLRPGRLDRKIEISLPNDQARLEILKIHSGPITKHGEIDYEAVVKLSDGFNGADLRWIALPDNFSKLSVHSWKFYIAIHVEMNFLKLWKPEFLQLG